MIVASRECLIFDTALLFRSTVSLKRLSSLFKNSTPPNRLPDVARKTVSGYQMTISDVREPYIDVFIAKLGTTVLKTIVGHNFMI